MNATQNKIESQDERCARLQRERLIAAGRSPIIATTSAWELTHGVTANLDAYDESGETDTQDDENTDE
jgi:hypothetical protein